MENNGIDEVLNESKEHNSYNQFKLDYNNQQLEGNIKFQKWKNLMIAQYGRNAKLFKCLNDDVLFYSFNKDCKKHPIYKSICPCCHKYICYFCHRYNNDEYASCCILRKICSYFLEDGLRFINPNGHHYSEFTKILKFFLIPGFHLIFLIFQIHIEFFYILATKKARNNNNKNYLLSYGEQMERNYTLFQVFIGFDVASSILLTFVFLLLNIYVIVFLLIISIPFRLYPMKYYMGIFFGLHKFYE